MARTVVALYDNFQDANNAVRELVDQGFKRDDVSLMAGDQKGDYSRYFSGTDSVAPAEQGDVASGASQGAGVGASIGAALGGIGGLLVGLGALVIPGIGPVLAAGPLAAALAGLAGAGAGALAGGITGGLIGALVDAGVPEETAQYYSEGVRRGGTLVTVRTEDHMSGQAVNIMNTHNPVDINTRAALWRDQGWTGVDATVDQDEAIKHETTATIRSTVDTGLETIEERYEENIPTTGDRDMTTGPTSMSGSSYDKQDPYSSAVDRSMGQHYPESASHDTDYGASSVREGEKHHDYSQPRGETEFGTPKTHAHDEITGEHTSSTSEHPDMPRGQDMNVSDREGRMNLSASDYDSARMSDSEYGTTGTAAEGEYNSTRGFHDFSYFQNNYQTHFGRGTFATTYTYDHYQPAYRYGYDLATDPRYTSREWNDVESEARRYWDDREPGAWDRFKDAVRYAWDSVRNAVD